MTGSTPPQVSHSPPAEPPGEKGDTKSAGTGPLRRRFRWPSPRTVLWLHIGVVCYTGAIVHLGIHDYLQLPGHNADISAEVPFPGEIATNLLIGAAILGFFSIYLFPPAMVVSLYRASPSWRLWLCGVVEALLVFAHALANTPWAIHVY